MKNFFTNKIDDSFATPGGLILGLTYDGTNLISGDDGTKTIYVHDGVSGTILSSFPTPGNNISGLTFDGTNLISLDRITKKIYIHDGISSTILSSFNAPGDNPIGLAFDGTNLISGDRTIYGYTDEIYIHDGISGNILSSFLTPADGIIGLTFDGTNLISCYSYDSGIYVHDGVSKNILYSFTSPGREVPAGLAFTGTNFISGDRVTDLLYIHKTMQVTDYFQIGASANDIAVDNITGNIKVGYTDETLVTYDGNTFSEISSETPVGISNLSALTILNGNTIIGDLTLDIIKEFGGDNRQFASPGFAVSGLTYDGTNLISCDNNSDLIYIHDGVSENILSSFGSPGPSVLGLAFDGTNLISCDNNSDLIYIHDGVSSTIKETIDTPITRLYGIGYYNGNLYLLDVDLNLVILMPYGAETKTYKPEGVYTSIKITNGIPFFKVKLEVNETKPAGTDIEYSVYSDISPEVDITPGVETSITGTDLYLTAIFKSNATNSATPSLQDRTITLYQ